MCKIVDQQIRQVRLLQLADCLAKQQCRNQPAACLDRRKRRNLRRRKDRVSLVRQQLRRNQRKREDSLVPLHLLHHNLGDYLALLQHQHNHRARDYLETPALKRLRRRPLREGCLDQHRLSSLKLGAGSLAVQTPRPSQSLSSRMYYTVPDHITFNKLIFPVHAP